MIVARTCRRTDRDALFALEYRFPPDHGRRLSRVTRSHEEFIAPGEFTFRARANAERLKDLVKFGWEMVRNEDGEVAGVGLAVMFLADDAGIREDYQFIER